jgi:hypothetical protein
MIKSRRKGILLSLAVYWTVRKDLQKGLIVDTCAIRDLW